MRTFGHLAISFSCSLPILTRSTTWIVDILCPHNVYQDSAEDTDFDFTGDSRPRWAITLPTPNRLRIRERESVSTGAVQIWDDFSLVENHAMNDCLKIWQPIIMIGRVCHQQCWNLENYNSTPGLSAARARRLAWPSPVAAAKMLGTRDETGTKQDSYG